MRAEIAEKLESLPSGPGVYLMKDAGGSIFYIGKAKSLRDRVRSYFSGSDTRAFVALLDSLLADIEVVLTNSDKEALLVEDQLVKRHQPRFNVELKDDKRYLCLRLDTRQAYPRLEVVRRFRKDGARYFGPYHSAASIREALRIINRHFQLRTCSDQVMRNRVRPCLQYQINRCPAPCVYDLRDGVYAENVENVVKFLQGRHEELLAALKKRMQEHSENLNFEAAAQLRDQIRAIEKSLERQRVITSDFANRDVVGLYREGPAVEIHVMRTRQGRLVDAQRFSFDELELPTDEVLADFATRYYGAAARGETRSGEQPQDVPPEILFPGEMQWADELAGVLSEQLGRTVRVLVPQRGDKKRLVDLARRNAHQAFADKQRESGAARTALEKLQRALHLRTPPRQIECFDISHLQGQNIVASLVRFDDGVANKSQYRHFTIRSTTTQDDFQSIYEAVGRRIRRGLEDGDLPDLLVIDGGRGQLAAARAALDDHGVDELTVIGLAKSRLQTSATGEQPAERSPERVFVEGRKNPLVLNQNSAELFLLSRARDEAHRFAISHQRKRKRKSMSQTALDSIPGVGPKRRKSLLRTFGSMRGVRQASQSQLAEVVGEKLAANISTHLHGPAAATEATDDTAAREGPPATESAADTP